MRTPPLRPEAETPLPKERGPVALSESPENTPTEPLLPDALWPDATMIGPLSPTLVAPVMRDAGPLTPAADESLVRSERPPVEAPFCEAPDEMLTLPVVDDGKAAEPADTVTEPPSPEEEPPTMRDRLPAEPPAEKPVDTSKEPALPREGPLLRATLPLEEAEEDWRVTEPEELSHCRRTKTRHPLCC
jgi:hypothetical protein